MSDTEQDTRATVDPLEIPDFLKKPKGPSATEAVDEPPPADAEPTSGPATTATENAQLNLAHYTHKDFGVPNYVWAYRDAAGSPVAGVARFDGPETGGKYSKTYRPFTITKNAAEEPMHQWRAPSRSRPLFNLDALMAHADAVVLVVEGEKTAEIAQDQFPDHVVTTSMGGASASAKTDWSPVMDRRVVIWPDNDKAGRNYARQVAKHAHKAGATSVGVVPVHDDFSAGWDLADEPPDGWGEARVRELLDSAEPISGSSVKPGQGDSQKATASKRKSPGWPFKVDDRGTWRRVPGEDGDAPTWEWVCSKLEVVALARNEDGVDWGRVLKLIDADSTEHVWAMPMAMTAGDGSAYREVLLGMGLQLAPGGFGRKMLHEYITLAPTDERVRSVDRIGWHGGVYVLPDEVYGDTHNETVVYQSRHTPDHAFRVAGTLEEWQENVARPCAGNTRLVFAVSAAFAAPLLHLLGVEGGGLNLVGQSSTGKTTALSVAGSVWGGGGIRGYVRTWRATANGLEGVMATHCDAFTALDELGQIDSREVGKAAYMIANGAGKSRANASGALRRPAEWRTVFLSTGEVGIADKVQEDGRSRATAGQEVRVVDVPADAGAGLGAFESLHGASDGDVFSRKMKEAATLYFGAPARAYLTSLVEDRDGAVDVARSHLEAFVDEYCPANADGQVKRVAARFALVAAAGELAAELGVVPWKQGEAMRAAGTCLTAWLAERGGTDPADTIRAMRQVRAYIEAHGSSRFESLPDEDEDDIDAEEEDEPDRRLDVGRTFNRLGFRKLDNNEEWHYYVFTEAWREEICRGLDPKAVAKTLADAGHVERDGEGNNSISMRFPGHDRMRVYHIRPSILGGE